ncbi:MAG: carboxypeptidase-like regulatory domain-containing protein, partial [Gemmatimonadota bacterium]|nr:carboxypeptidase-like regulatory domain-containing protein [Gemmatimonadota bacterium]
MLSLNTRSNLRSVTRPAILSLFAALLSVACDGRNDPLAPTPTLTGTVTNPATGRPVAGAAVSVGAAIVTTGADGRFNVPDLAMGPATLRCTATGFADFEAPVTVTSGIVTQDVGLTRIEVFEFGDFALYVPATVDTTRGIILALGGPNTKGFANGKPFGAPIPAVEASLQALGQQFRALASARGLAVLGTSRSAMANGAASDQVLLDGIATAAAMSGRP